jgi:hypothetical protein
MTRPGVARRGALRFDQRIMPLHRFGREKSSPLESTARVVAIMPSPSHGRTHRKRRF